MEELQHLTGQLAGYGSVIATILAVMLGGIAAVVMLYKLATSVINPAGHYARAMKVGFGTLYAMILVVTCLLAAEKIGLNVAGLGGPVILLVMVASVIVFFLLPFLPRLPFVVGDMVQIKDVMGTVEAMTAYQVVMRTFDGQTVFIPTAVAMASAIRNFSAIPHRRIEMKIDIYAADDIERARSMLLEKMNDNPKVIEDPAPAVYIVNVTGERASMVAYCWVENADWFATRDALWVAVSSTFAADDKVNLALPQLDVISAP
ncbi:mechanosensitive ion channel [Halioglobus maricola]|uniref:Small-conductance mechanosensitive channel n=1 Tax=Halioglobus maricola TaxID=2601894 RepID=A0A5P9NNA9_9GAMM|nr:mechanosensitive ion channel domain-containing protein [Halioglobus maricola]QFU77139.1 mechanosensitive ion channel [Halioglobus maricola]